jgi:hypothetical protein
VFACTPPISGATRRCPVQPNTPLGPDQVNVLLLLLFDKAIGSGSKLEHSVVGSTRQIQTDSPATPLAVREEVYRSPRTPVSSSDSHSRTLHQSARKHPAYLLQPWETTLMHNRNRRLVHHPGRTSVTQTSAQSHFAAPAELIAATYCATATPRTTESTQEPQYSFLSPLDDQPTGPIYSMTDCHDFPRIRQLFKPSPCGLAVRALIRRSTKKWTKTPCGKRREF